MSSGFALLPPEILLEVLEILAENETGPVTGYDAAWINPLALPWPEDPFETVTNGQKSGHSDIANLQR
jgi:hypothetical protein